jgi:hypothetical protein
MTVYFPVAMGMMAAIMIIVVGGALSIGSTILTVLAGATVLAVTIGWEYCPLPSTNRGLGRKENQGEWGFGGGK